MPRAESSNKWIDRNRAPRVHISYDVEDGGALRRIELPFVVGVMAGLSGDRTTPLPDLVDRKFDQVDIDNFDAYLKKQAPRVAFNVENALEGEGQLNVDVAFEALSQFSPDELAKKIGSTSEEIVLTKSADNSYAVSQGGPIAEKIGASVSSPDEITTAMVASRLALDPAEVEVQMIKANKDKSEVTLRVTRKGPLAILLEARNSLTELIARADGKRKAEDILRRIMGDKDLQNLLAGPGGPAE